MFTIRRALIAALLLVAAAPVAFAADAPTLVAADRAAIQAVIRDQLDAFARDDADRAFAHAAPDIRTQVGSPAAFMRMVETGYAPVYRSASATFERLQRIEGTWVQLVRLVDEDGAVWRAAYSMQRQRDRQWKIAGCQLARTQAIAS